MAPNLKSPPAPVIAFGALRLALGSIHKEGSASPSPWRWCPWHWETQIKAQVLGALAFYSKHKIIKNTVLFKDAMNWGHMAVIRSWKKMRLSLFIEATNFTLSNIDHLDAKCSVRQYCLHASSKVNQSPNCKHLKSPRVDSKETISPVYVAWQASTSNRVVVYCTGLPGWETIPGLLKRFANSGTVREYHWRVTFASLTQSVVPME
jgi:hypothetical protein